MSEQLPQDEVALSISELIYTDSREEVESVVQGIRDQRVAVSEDE